MHFLPTSERELLEALTSGTLQESHFLDFKETLPAPPAGNKSIAKDLASFSIDGGVLVIGVAEGDNGFLLNPIDSTGMSERLEQIAFTSVEPPIVISTQFIPSSSNPGLGYLVVNIPASDHAPHMVDNRYMARNDKTQRSLTHAEVMRFHENSLSRKSDQDRQIRRQIARDPVPTDLREYPHLHLTATPRLTSKPLLLETLRHSDRSSILRAWLTESGSRVPETPTQSRHSFVSLVSSEALRHDGIALYGGNMDKSRAIGDANLAEPERILEIEFSQEGQLRFFNGQAGFNLTISGGVSNPGLAPQLLIEQAREFIELVYIVARDLRFGGRWDFSVAITGIGGITVHRGNELWGGRFTYEKNAEDYIAHASGDLNEIENTPGTVLETLLGRFARSLDMEQHFQAYFD